MHKEIEQKIKESMILDDNEPILSLIQVSDYLKYQQQIKKIAKDEIAASLITPNKNFFLLASIKVDDNDSTPLIYLLKQDEKTNDLKLKVTWALNEIKSITQIDGDSSLPSTPNTKSKSGNASSSKLLSINGSTTFRFELSFHTSTGEERRFIWQCDKQQERLDFLNTLWKLSEQFLKISDRPKFINFKFETNKSKGDQVNALTSSQVSTQSTNSMGGSSGLSGQFEISKNDEDSLLKLMNECDFASSNAEKFMQKLQTELTYLDTSNIESIMNSEENTIRLIEMLDDAVNEIEKIDQRLKDYEDKISAVGDAVRIVGERDNVIQLQQTNQHALLDLLEDMMSKLEFSKDSRSRLMECDLSTQSKINQCSKAANELIDILHQDFPPALKKMKAYEEQIKSLEVTKIRFCSNSFTYIKNSIGHSINKHLESYKIEDNSLTSLPPHRQIHDELLALKDIMAWIYRSNCYFNNQEQKKTFYYNDIKQYYIETIRPVYAREIGPFCFCARAKIYKNDKQKSNASMENIKGSFIRSLDKSHTSESSFSIRVDQTTKETLKMVFIKLMNQISTAIQNEQSFVQEFFNVNNVKTGLDEDNKSLMKSSIASTTSSMKQLNISSETKSDLMILNEIFFNLIEDHIRSIMDSINRSENMMVIFIYSDLLYRVLVSHNNKQYMHQPLVSLLRTGKEKCDEYVNHFKDQIREHKVNKREKIGILKYVWYFEEFVKEAEACWEPIKNNMYEKLCIIYQQLVNEIFKGIESVAIESQKTPPHVVRFQNYHQMLHIMRSINGLKDMTKYAKDQYSLWEQNYVKEHFGRPLEKLSNFFEKVDTKIERGIRPEDISYQFELSANNLKEIIREYPAKEVKKGLDTLYYKVQKHLVERSSLLEVVWRDMTNEFLRQYKNYESLIKKCYPDQKITFEFTEQDICDFFRDIAQTH